MQGHPRPSVSRRELKLLRRDGGKGREGRERRGEERRGEGEVRRVRKARGKSRSPVAGCYLPATDAVAICATPDLLLKHPDETFAAYI
jgi:hypothetical protein